MKDQSRFQIPLWKITYFFVAACLFGVAAWNRFSLPQDPLSDGDPGYLWPALMKLSGQPFAHIQGLNFLYPSMIYLILRTCSDFRAISVIQHLLGLAAGALFLARWSRLRDFLPRSPVNRIAHEAIGLWGATIYLLSNTPLLLEMQIRSDSVCMFFEILTFSLIIQFFRYRIASPNGRKAVVYGAAVAVNAFLLASLKPSFTLMALFSVLVVIYLVLAAKGNLTGKIAFFSIVIPIVVALALVEHHLRRDDTTAKVYLPETLFVIHANIIHAQMATDLKNGVTTPYSSQWLRVVSDDLNAEIQSAHHLSPQKFSVLGFEPEKLRGGSADPLLNRWRRELGDEQFLRFLKYWYWHSLAKQPLAFVEKIVRQIGVFYSRNCPAFSLNKNLPLSSWAYAASFSTLSRPEWLRQLVTSPAGSDFLERTKNDRLSHVVIHENKRVRMWNNWCARSYLAVLLVSLPLAVWFLVKRKGTENLMLPAFLVVYFYSANFGNVFGLSVVHTMEVWRYSAVQFIAALFAQLWAIRWLLEIALIKLRTSRRARSSNEQGKIPNATLVNLCVARG